jgi:hypothetical protein
MRAIEEAIIARVDAYYDELETTVRPNPEVDPSDVLDYAIEQKWPLSDYAEQLEFYGRVHLRELLCRIHKGIDISDCCRQVNLKSVTTSDIFDILSRLPRKYVEFLLMRTHLIPIVREQLEWAVIKGERDRFIDILYENRIDTSKLSEELAGLDTLTTANHLIPVFRTRFDLLEPLPNQKSLDSYIEYYQAHRDDFSSEEKRIATSLFESRYFPHYQGLNAEVYIVPNPSDQFFLGLRPQLHDIIKLRKIVAAVTEYGCIDKEYGDVLLYRLSGNGNPDATTKIPWNNKTSAQPGKKGSTKHPSELYFLLHKMYETPNGVYKEATNGYDEVLKRILIFFEFDPKTQKLVETAYFDAASNSKKGIGTRAKPPREFWESLHSIDENVFPMKK